MPTKTNTLQQYLYAIAKLRCAPTKYGPAPHKPILLLSLIEQVEKGYVAANRFYLTPELVGTFVENWRLLVTTLHQCDVTQPLFYLQSDRIGGEAFWFLVPKTGLQINAYIKSINVLSDILAYGTMKEELFVLLQDPISRASLQQVLLNRYFPETKSELLKHKQIGDGFLHQLEGYILNEPEVKLKKLYIQTEEEIFVRSGLFKKYIPQLYRDTCAITGMRLTSVFSRNFIDACHIVPFSVSHDDKVDNGIALCPNMHRAFDRGLVSIDENFKILVSPHINENDDSTYCLARLKSKKIMLPYNNRYWPKHDNLEWHRKYVFKS